MQQLTSTEERTSEAAKTVQPEGKSQQTDTAPRESQKEPSAATVTPTSTLEQTGEPSKIQAYADGAKSSKKTKVKKSPSMKSVVPEETEIQTVALGHTPEHTKPATPAGSEAASSVEATGTQPPERSAEK